MYIQSGELVIILRDKFRIGNKIWHSLRFRIIILVIVIGIVPAFIMEAGILKSYERRAVSVRTAEIQNQCTILSNQLSSKSYLIDTSSEIINAELMQLSNTYNGRVMIVNQEFQIIKDTYELDEGKTIVSADVIKCYQSGVGTDSFDSKNQYIEVTQPIVEITSGDIRGVMLVSVSTDVINDNMSALETNAEAIMIMIIIIVMVMGIVMAGLVMRPFRRIANEVEAVTEGYDTENLNENTYTETQLISEAVNKMLIRLRVLDDSRQEFVSNVSHELKTPLTSMKVLADSLLLQEKVPNELYKEFMGDITEEIERENKIINDLLSLVKMDRKAADLNIQSVSINELLELILKRLRPIAALH
ncbi:MAG: HAMP domain-containing sensor histidine kinase, partial [Lachnospiraceae bacterium]|nr:HAMP domain-containing sensor histidine kinase [Lachnospiraceae bacterium]